MFDEYFQDKIDQAESGSPEYLAQQLFSKEPEPRCSKSLIAYSQHADNDAVSFVFEVLMTIYLEGFMNILEVAKQKSAEDDADYQAYVHMTVDDLKFPEPWFNSIGYSIDVQEYEVESKPVKEISKLKSLSYCRVLLSFDQKDMFYFLINKVNKKYTFILNKSYIPTSKLEKIYALLTKDKKIYRISFKQIFN
jgi:hypothetical protein